MASGTIKPKSTIASGTIKPGSALSGKSSAGGTNDHNRLTNRDLNDQHPISAISGLEKVLESKIDSETIQPIIKKIEKNLNEALKNKAQGMYFDAMKEFATKPYWYLTSEIDERTGLGTKESVFSGPYNLGAGGGGAGGGGLTRVRISNIDPETQTSMWTNVTALGSDCTIKVYWTSTLEGEETGNGTLYLYVNNKVVTTKTASQGYVDFEVGKYLNAGSNRIEVKVVDSYSGTANIIGEISTISVELTSNFNYLLNYTGTVNYIYIPYGDIAKTVYVYIDGELHGTQQVLSTGEQMTYSINGLKHGHHSLRVYFECSINEETIKSNELYYDLIVYEATNPTPIIASQFVKLEQSQYVAFNIPYRVYTPGRNNSEVYLYVNDEEFKYLPEVNQDEQIWEYKSNVAGTYKLTIKTGDITRDFEVHIKQSEIEVNPVSENLKLSLTTYGRNNTEPEEERLVWEDTSNNLRCELNNFNFSSDGWVKDAEGNTVLRVSGDARVVIPYKPFETDFRSFGKTIEIEFATSAVRDYESIIINCFDESRGFYITPQLAKIKSQQCELQTQYKEDDHIRLSLVVEKNTENRIIWMFVNGIANGAVRYPSDDAFRQLDPQNITIGSNDAIIDIYNIKIYDNNLNRKQIVNNWIADTQDGELRIERYLRNDNYNEKNELVYNKLPDYLPYLIAKDLPNNLLPQFKGDKRTGNAEFVEPLNDKRSFTSIGLQYNVQGTSSAVYPVKNLKLNFGKGTGFIDINGDVYELFSVGPDDIGANEITLKVDYASSEGANNVELVKIYNDAVKQFCKTPPQKIDDRVRVGINGFPAVLFQEVNGKINFISKMNFNNDKANEDVFGFIDGDESWEITNNNTYPALFITPATEENWQNSFEARYPDVGEAADISRLKEMTNWVVSTNQDAATNEPFDNPVEITYTEKYLGGSNGTSFESRVVTREFASDSREYRLAKFKSELTNYFDLNSSLFYYIFTELFLMVDSRAKNAFPTYFVSRRLDDGGNKWFWLPYDMDTAIGINNEGDLVFDYSLEDTDLINDEEYVYNGQISTFWNNIRDAFNIEIREMYTEIRTAGIISFDEVERRFKEHQDKWTENVFNEDSYVKYIKPLVDNGTNYLDMLQGSKSQQRRWWLYNRFKYMDSKYNAGDAKADAIILRAYAKDDISITPYADIYATVQYGNTMPVSTRAVRGNTYTLENPLEEVNDTEYAIFSASQLKSIGDISTSKVGLLDASKAVKLQDLIVGSGEEGYTNTNLKSLTLGNNILLKTLDVRNCVNLESSIDISNCTNIEYVYFDNTKISGIQLPVGGILKKIHLPETLTKLTIRNHLALEELVIEGTDNIQTLWLENIPSNTIDAYSIITAMKDNSEVRLIGINNKMNSAEEIKLFYDRLDKMVGLDSFGETVSRAQVTGKIYIDVIGYEDYMNLKDRYEEVTLVPNKIICTVNFFNEGVLHNSQLIEIGKDAQTPEIPLKSSTQKNYYTFNCWDTEYTNVQCDLNINAIFDEHLQVYTVEFDTESGAIATPSFQDVEYGYTCNIPEISNIPESVEFLGWFYENGNKFDFNTPIEDDLHLYAHWNDTAAPTIVLEKISFNKFKYDCKDNVGIIGWKIDEPNKAPAEWNIIEPQQQLSGEFEISSSGKYSLQVRDAQGLTKQESIEAIKFTRELTTGVTEISITENDIELTDFALYPTKAKIVATMDSHYSKLIVSVRDDKNPTWKAILNGEERVIEANTVYKAECTPKTYEVKFDSMGKGETPETQFIVYNNRLIEPTPQFVRIDEQGYSIEGWYKEGMSERWNFDDNVVTENLTLYANWVEYTAPTELMIKTTIDTGNDVSVNFSQTEAYGVRIEWGDGSSTEGVDRTGYCNINHTYAEYGDYTIKVFGVKGEYLLGRTFDSGAISPIEVLTNVNFSWDIVSTEAYAFRGAVNVKEFKLTEFMTSVAEGAFYECSNSKIILGKNIVQIGNNAFQYCSSIVDEADTMVLPEKLISIGDYAFSGCNFSEVVLPNSLTNVGLYVFAACSNLKKVNFPTNLKYIGYAMFNETAFKEIDIPETIELIKEHAFTACYQLEKVILRNKNLNIEANAFNYCTSLISAGPISKTQYSIEFAWDRLIPTNAFFYGFGSSSLEYIELPKTIEQICANAFRNCDKLGTNPTDYPAFKLSNSIKTIGESAFSYCTSLTNIDIPSSVTSIEPRIFEQCIGLQDVMIYTASSTFKVGTWEDSWFKQCNPNLRLHIPAIIESPQLAMSAYGNCWNHYYDGEELEYSNDLI